jgi:ubiquinone/menaquinone biosynthesis C-methylase UbiE
MDGVVYWRCDRGINTADWLHGYWTSQDAPHRLRLLDEVRRLQPKSLLEVGCHCGPNLRLIGASCPECELRGFDCNAGAIESGKAWLAEAGVPAELRVGDLPGALAEYGTGSVEWVMSCYVLVYVPPGQLVDTLREMWRVASKGLVLFEWAAFSEQMYVLSRQIGPTNMSYDEYQHPYLEILNRLPEFAGAMATVMETDFSDNMLNALIVVQR